MFILHTESETIETFAFIVKVMITTYLPEALVNSLHVCEKEFEMYEKIIPEFEDIWLKSTGEVIQFGPKFVF